MIHRGHARTNFDDFFKPMTRLSFIYVSSLMIHIRNCHAKSHLSLDNLLDNIVYETWVDHIWPAGINSHKRPCMCPNTIERLFFDMEF